MLPEVGRRRFLIGAVAAAATTVVAVGCGSSSPGGSGAQDDPTTTAAGRAVDPVDAPGGRWNDRPLFTLGVASGDPTSSSVILWTRLAAEPTADDGTGGLPDQDIAVAWELAADEGFSTVLASELVPAKAAHGHAVHVDAQDLEPGTTYWYRFRIGDQTSTVGQTATLPDGSPDSFGLAVVNCQMYEGGAYGAYRNLVDEDVDLVVHLGVRSDGTRRVEQIAAVPGRAEAGVVQLADVFRTVEGVLVRGDGFPPGLERFERAGIDIAAELRAAS